jgi:hypothetical protein
MDMDAHQISLAAAGLLGGGIALVHGALTQRALVAPALKGISGSPRAIGKLVAVLLQFSTFNWLVCGIALVLAAVATDAGVRLAIGLLVGTSYLFAVVANSWATRGRHPGWMLYAGVLVLMAYGLAPDLAMHVLR